MGGYNSGRPGWHALVEGAFVLDVGMLVKQGGIVPGRAGRGSVTWDRAGKEAASVGFDFDLTNPDQGSLRLRYRATRQGVSSMEDYEIRLAASELHLGGRRWWFICPVSGRRGAKLYLPPGATIFAGRQAHRLVYRSQRNNGLARSHSRQHRIYERLGAHYVHFEQGPPTRPKWMRQKTYERLLARLDAAERAHQVVFIAGAKRILARFPGRVTRDDVPW